MILLVAVLLIAIIEALYIYNEKTSKPEGFGVSSGWKITSYCLVNEALYSGDKVEVFDSYGNSLGFYKSDFLEQIRTDGAGNGDGIQNPGKYLHYDYGINDGKTCYLADKSLGAYGEVRDWNDDKPTVAVNPQLPGGTMIRFADLGPEGGHNPDWVVKILEDKTFYVMDTFFGMGDEKRIDVFVGLQKVKDPIGTAESLLMHDVTIRIGYPE